MRLPSFRSMWVVVAFLGMILSPALLAQTSGTGALSGTVTDPTGSVVPNATVTLTSVTGQVRNATTGSDGAYSIGLLPPGNYSVTIQAAGFKTAEIPGVTVTVTETAVLNRQLEVGAQTEKVTVEANVETVQTENATVGSTISGQTVTDLPLASRNYTNLLSLTAGANANVTNAAVLGKASQETAVNGSSTQQNNYQMDGASIVSYSAVGGVSEGGSRGAFGIPNPDTIQEFKIQTSQYDSGYGRNPGANVNVITKGGTNDFHGNAFEYFRNTQLNSADWFAKNNGVTGNAARRLDQNQFGGTFGGPVKKDKLFFFTSYQGTAQKNGLAPAGQATSLIPALPAGNRGTCPAASTLAQCEAADANVNTFVHALGALYNGKTGNFGGEAVAANGSNINPVALRLLELKIANGGYLVPTPPSAGGQASPGISCGPVQQIGFNPVAAAGAASCTAASPAIYHEYQGMGNWDYVINNKNTLSGRYFYATSPSIQQFYFGPTVLGNGDTPRFTNHEATLKLTTILSNTLVNEARASYQRNLVDASTTSSFSASAVGMTALNCGAACGSTNYDVIPQVIIGNLAFGTPIFGTTTNHVDQFEWADQLSWTHGKQTIRTGVEIDHNNWNWNFTDGLGAGLIVFASPADFLLGLPGQCGAASATCNGSFFSNIIAAPNFATRFTPGGGDFHFWNFGYSAFIQDDIKLTPRFTLNAGVRWEYDGYPSERQGKGTNIDPTLALTQPLPVTAAPCPNFPAACPGSTLVGYTVPSNFNTAALGAIPAGVLKRNQKTLGGSSTPRDDFAPRVGFAWQPLHSSKFVIRGGGGFFYDMIGGELYIHGVLQSVPFAETLGQGGPANAFASLQVPYATTPPNWLPRWVTSSNETSNINQPYLQPSLPVPVTYQWNLNTQYEFLPTWVVELGYVGSRGVHQNTGSFPANPALLVNDPVTHSAPSSNNFNLRVPYLGFSTGLAGFANNTDDKYNSLQATVRKNFTHGFTFQAAYTWSRAFASNWVGNGAPKGVITNPTWALPPIISQYGLNSQYHPQRLTLNYSYNLPFGHMQGWMGVATSGWRVSGETTIQDGSPLTVQDGGLGTIFAQPTTSSAQYRSGMGNRNAAATGSINSRVLNGWINTGAFCSSTASGDPCQNAYSISDGFGFGNAGQGNLLGPPQDNWDISLAKITKVGGLREDATLEFRTEFFNAFNHPQFNNPGSTDVSSGAVGLITSTSVNPRLIQFALKYTF